MDFHDEPLPDEPRRGGSGPMIFVLIGGMLLCGGTMGGVAFVAWKISRTTATRAERAREEAVATEQMERVQQEQSDVLNRQSFERVARAMADGLQAHDRLADSYSADGKPLLSWRVHLLPRLGEEKLYRKFKLDEPWDSPANLAVATAAPSMYRPMANMQWTHIRGFSQAGAIFEPRAHYILKDVPAGPQNTLAIVDSAEPIFWTRPDNWTWEARQPRPKLGWMSPGRDWFLAASADGRVWQIRRNISDDILQQLFDRRHEHRAADLLGNFGKSE